MGDGGVGYGGGIGVWHGNRGGVACAEKKLVR